ncbi:MAG TPA: hypothetical protein VNQ79_09080 [Blastocatellia bacterium]|nr:hypothetical protein [Blastocatellia bacterium]
MTHTAFNELKNVREEDYFHRREQEFIERLRRRMALEAECRELAETLGINDLELLRTLQEMGYTRATVRLLYLVPLVQVAWAEGGVSRSERELILKAARLRGIEPGSAAYERLTEWLDERPSEEFFERTLRLISTMLQALPPEEREADRRDLVAYCTRVAEVSGGLVGFVGLSSRVCREERELLERIAAELERDGSATLQLVKA